MKHESEAIVLKKKSEIVTAMNFYLHVFPTYCEAVYRILNHLKKTPKKLL